MISVLSHENDFFSVFIGLICLKSKLHIHKFKMVEHTTYTWLFFDKHSIDSLNFFGLRYISRIFSNIHQLGALTKKNCSKNSEIKNWI